VWKKANLNFAVAGSCPLGFCNCKVHRGLGM